ncbi:CAP domain-containing protein [Zhouia spongiae]|uniref:CAP domain-containing protein n=1 Tax=Zhouia spongiae TaxID=2202721 RepID=A0ABY3YLG3_9FLAO|nr:CAP domain-containing protein [Zhouia spongiae]UNY98662.1 CAP domain-containing protein [Zhouia spongiae]
MKSILLLASLVMMPVFLTSCSKEELLSEENVAIDIKIEDLSLQEMVVELINDHREDSNLKVLDYLKAVKDVAASHTDYMIEKGEVSHEYFFTREKELKEKVNAILVGENVAYGYSTAKGVVDAWLASTKHRDNIDGDFTHIGVSAKKNAEGRVYYTLMLVKK